MQEVLSTIDCNLSAAFNRPDLNFFRAFTLAFVSKAIAWQHNQQLSADFEFKQPWQPSHLIQPVELFEALALALRGSKQS